MFAPSEKFWTTKCNFRIQVHIKFVNWQLKPMSEEMIPVKLSQKYLTKWPFCGY